MNQKLSKAFLMIFHWTSIFTIICGVYLIFTPVESACVHNNPLTLQDFLIAKSRIDLFDLVLAQDMMEDVESIRRLFESEFPSLQFRQLGVKSRKGDYKKVNLTQFQNNFIQNQTEMDKVLYEYGKILHQRRIETLLMQQHVWSRKREVIFPVVVVKIKKL